MLKYLLLIISLLAGASAAGAPAPVLSPQCLALEAAGRPGRSLLQFDPVEALLVTGQWRVPHAGDAVQRADGSSRAWTAATATAASDGWLSARAPGGGYVLFTAEAHSSGVALLEAVGDQMVYVNGVPRAGDPYGTGWVRLPIALQPGANQLLFQCGRGPLRVRLAKPAAAALLDTRDATLPDLVVGERAAALGTVVVVNATDEPMGGLALRAALPHSRATANPVPVLPPLSVRKVAFRCAGAAPAAPGSTEVDLTLEQTEGSGLQRLETARVPLRVRRPTETQKRTFISEIDGSVQYYAVNPPAPRLDPAAPLALFLTLHGAGVEAIGQADAYESKPWGVLVAPTNRRPYGFDWEDWGRLDALEVLSLAQRQWHTDPQRTYLTGHSMGGHGTWHLGVTFPDRFAAIGPSAGWISFASYAGGARESPSTPMQQLLDRAALPGDTLALLPNTGAEGVYILHGGADDNVPVTQARTMRDRLSSFHHDFVYYEQPGVGHWWDLSDEPGADCVDWAPLFDFFARHALPADDQVRQVDFVTASPGVSARCHWATIEAQTHPFELSSLTVRCDPGVRRFTGKTTNIARLSLRLDPLLGAGPVTIELDGQKLEKIPVPPARQIWLSREAGGWRAIAPPSPSLKGPERYGPFKEAFRHRVLFVYGTHGTPEENSWSLAKARYDAETFWYRGNGSIDLIADRDFDSARERDRSVVLYGNRDTNAAWNVLLAGSPVSVRRGVIQVGSRELRGDDLACLFLRPRAGSRQATVGVVGGSGLTGMRLTDRMPYFVSGVEYPDLIVLGPDTLTRGSEGVRAAGFFGPDWGVSTGDFVWRE